MTSELLAQNLSTFGLPETLRTGRAIRRAATDAESLEEAAQQVCETLYSGLREVDGTSPACALVRCYKTHGFGALPSSLQEYARATAPAAPLEPDTKCLVLLGTTGDEPAWNSRLTSRQHQVVPLYSVEVIQQAPMIAQLFNDFGVELQQVVKPGAPDAPTLRARTYGVFYVEDAHGNSAIPAQDFVKRYGVTSVIGCGGELPRGEMFAVILFTRVALGVSVAERFRKLALDMKASFFRFTPSETFRQGDGDATR